jgi:hypothetical protein
MRCWTSGRVGLLCTVLAACVFLAAAPRQPPAQEKPAVSCAFSNPAYAGLCHEKAPLQENQTPEQACQGILACLNDSRCLRSYCNATTVRGGWKLASATADASKKEK